MKKKYLTLVLNKYYYPIHLISWKRAISLLYQGIALSLDQDFIAYNYDSWVDYSRLPDFDETYYNFVSSPSITVAVPDVLVLKKYEHLPMRDVKYTRENVFHRDKNRCAYCGKKFKNADLTIDHIIPKSRGGDNSWKNTITSCKFCNNKKADRTPREADMILLYRPIEPRWTDALSKVKSYPDVRPTWIKFLDSIGA